MAQDERQMPVRAATKVSLWQFILFTANVVWARFFGKSEIVNSVLMQCDVSLLDIFVYYIDQGFYFGKK